MKSAVTQAQQYHIWKKKKKRNGSMYWRSNYIKKYRLLSKSKIILTTVLLMGRVLTGAHWSSLGTTE